MKKLFLLASCLIISFNAFANEPGWISVKQSIVRSTPSFLGAVVARVKYEQQLTVTSKDKDWWQVQVDNKTGWIHHSAVSTELVQRVSSVETFKSGETSEEVKREQTENITLAGKGFNKETEAEYAKGNSKLNFEQVDIMENRSLAGFNVDQFAADGGLVHIDPEKLNQARSEKSSGSIIEKTLDFF